MLKLALDPTSAPQLMSHKLIIISILYVFLKAGMMNKGRKLLAAGSSTNTSM